MSPSAPRTLKSSKDDIDNTPRKSSRRGLSFPVPETQTKQTTEKEKEVRKMFFNRFTATNLPPVYISSIQLATVSVV